MIRLLLRLFGIKDFDTCKSCETLKQQLEYERDEKRRLTDTLLAIVAPKVVESPPVEINQVVTTAGLFSRRRAILEAKDREEARIKASSTNLGKPDDTKVVKLENPNAGQSVEALEKELGIEEKEA